MQRLFWLLTLVNNVVFPGVNKAEPPCVSLRYIYTLGKSFVLSHFIYSSIGPDDTNDVESQQDAVNKCGPEAWYVCDLYLSNDLCKFSPVNTPR